MRKPVGLLMTWLLVLSLACCQRAPYALLPASRGAYLQPKLQPAASATLAALPVPVPSLSSPATARRHHASKWHSLGRRGIAVGVPQRAFPGVVSAVMRPQVLRQKAVFKNTGDGFKKNPRKGLFWRLFWWGFFLMAVTVAIIGITTAAPAAAGGTVAMAILKDFLIGLPIVAAAAGVLSLTIRLIWPHDPTRG